MAGFQLLNFAGDDGRARMTLRPGDVIATGTPAGVGRPRGIFLNPGDTVRINIGGIGELSNSVVEGE